MVDSNHVLSRLSSPPTVVPNSPQLQTGNENHTSTEKHEDEAPVNLQILVVEQITLRKELGIMAGSPEDPIMKLNQQYLEEVVNDDLANNVSRRQTGKDAPDERSSTPADDDKDQEDLQANNPQKGGATLSSSVVNIAMSTLGAGILSVPYGFSQTGWFLGIVVLTCAYMTTIYTNVMLADVMAATTNTSSSSSACLNYKDMAKKALSNFPLFAYTVDAAVVELGFAMGAAYTIVATDNLSAVTGTSRWIWPILFTATTAPLCSLKHIDSLRFSSTFALFCLLFMAAVIAAYAVADDEGTDRLLDPCSDGDFGNNSKNEDLSPCRGDIIASHNNAIGIMKGFIFFIQGLVCHFTSPSIIREMDRPTRLRVAVAYAGGSGIAYGLFIVVGLSGYWTYGDQLKGNILTLYPDDALTSTVRVLVSLVVVLGYPMTTFSSRESMKSFLKKMNKTVNKNSPDLHLPTRVVQNNDNDGSFASWWRTLFLRYTVLLDVTEMTITLVWLTLTTVVALFVTDIAIPFGIAGATGTAYLFYVAPGLMRFFSYKDQTGVQGLLLARVLDIASVVFGVLVFCFGIAGVFT